MALRQSRIGGLHSQEIFGRQISMRVTGQLASKATESALSPCQSHNLPTVPLRNTDLEAFSINRSQLRNRALFLQDVARWILCGQARNRSKSIITLPSLGFVASWALLRESCQQHLVHCQERPNLILDSGMTGLLTDVLSLLHWSERGIAYLNAYHPN